MILYFKSMQAYIVFWRLEYQWRHSEVNNLERNNVELGGNEIV